MSLVSKMGSVTFQLATVDDLWPVTWRVLSRNVAKCIGNPIVKKMAWKNADIKFFGPPDGPMNSKITPDLDIDKFYMDAFFNSRHFFEFPGFEKVPKISKSIFQSWWCVEIFMRCFNEYQMRISIFKIFILSAGSHIWAKIDHFTIWSPQFPSCILWNR